MKVLLADDHALIRSGLRSELGELGCATDFIEAWDADTLRHAFEAHADLDLAMVDLGMPGMRGVQTIAGLRHDHPTVPLLVVSACDDTAEVRAVLQAGAAGFIPKSALAKLMLPAIQLVLAGGRYLPPQLLHALDRDGWSGPLGSRPTSAAQSPENPSGHANAASRRRELLSSRQQQVFDLLARGLSNKLIARELDISEATVKSHVATIFDLLHVHNRVAAVAEARRLSGKLVSTE